MELIMITKKLIQALFERFITIYGKKFTHDFDGHEARVVMWVEDWYEGLLGIPPETFKDALYYIKTNYPWPPSLPEFRCVCERSMGLPSQADIIDLAIRQDFSHPLTKMVYDKITSFNFRNWSQDKLEKAVAECYPHLLAKLRLDTYESCVKQIAYEERKLLSA
jgi:hypothetical protein